MELNKQETKSYLMDFHGKGENFFGIIIINWLLTTITLGFYYPWAKEKKLKFLYGESTLDNSPFEFHGTGKEMFKGFITAVGIFITLFAITFSLMSINKTAGILFLYAALFCIIPVAIHGTYKYRMSRTSWRGIRFGYRGDRKELIVNFLKWTALTVITLGLYGSWFTINLRKYIVKNLRLGSIEMDYEGEGTEYFMLNLKGILLTLVTFGIYSFWWQKDIFHYYINNLKMRKGNEELNFNTNITGGELFVTMLINNLIVMFTLGIGYAWAQMRLMKFALSSIELEGNLDLKNIQQTEAEYKNATGEDLGDMLDMDLVI